MAKTLTEMTAEIVAAQASHKPMTAEEMDAALRKTFEALQCIQYVEEGKMSLEREGMKDELAQLRAEPMKSIQRNCVINLEDGKKYKQLTARTLAKFGLTPREYRRKWGLTTRQPLSAKSLTAKRRKTAKSLGLGERLREARKTAATATKRPPRRKRVEAAPVQGA
jgi:predicted transcriptional regulator